jgi:hypothetical protein
MHNKLSIDIERLCAVERIPIAQPGDRHYHYGWVSMPCPFCRGDAGNHLGFSPKYNVFTCWRCGRHTIGEVLSMLLQKPKYEAVQYALEHYSLDPYSALQHKKRDLQRPFELAMIGSKTPHELHTKYLESRNIDTQWLIDNYDARFTQEHETHRWRVILPVWYDGKYVSYVGRDVTGNETRRYLTCYPEKEVRDIKQCLFGMQRAVHDTVIVTEGPFDALRIGEGAVAVLGTGWNQEQARLVGTRFKRSYILFDAEKDAIIRARKMAAACSMFPDHKSSVITLSGEQGKDPASLPETTIIKLRNLIYGKNE